MWIKHKSRYLLLAMAVTTSVVNANALTQESLQAFFEQWSPALCVLKFTQAAIDPRTGEEQQQQGSAVAVVVSPDGLLMSNGYLQRENVTTSNFRVVVLRDGEETEYKATLLEKPKDVNISFLRIKSDAPLNLPSVRFTRNSRLGLGEEVAILGVMSETMDFQPTLSVARVSAILESPRITYCLDTPLKLGSVTGPVINDKGEVVGVTGFELSSTEGGDLYTRSGVPMVFQTELFIPYVDSPPGESAEEEEGGEEAWLGVFTQPLKEDYAEYWGIAPPGGLIVSTVMPGSSAEAAGFQPGDIIRVFDGQPIQATLDRDVLDFTQLIRGKQPGAAVTVELLRGGAPLTLQVTLGVRPRSAQEAGEYTDETLGLVVREITQDLRTVLNLGEDVQGVIVRRVISGSPAHVARMQPGVIVMSIDNTPVTSVEDYEKGSDAIRAAKPAEVSIFARAGAATGFFRVRPRW